MPPYEVKRGYVTAETNVGAGRAHIDFPAGAVLPEDVPAEELDALARTGAIVLVPETEAAPADDAPAGRPGKSASKARWVAFAVSVYDITEDAANSFSKDELIQLVDSGDLDPAKTGEDDEGQDGDAAAEDGE